MSLAQHRIVSTESRADQLARLEQQHKQWVAECAQIERRHPVEARNLAEAISDLRILIDYVRKPAVTRRAESPAHAHVPPRSG